MTFLPQTAFCYAVRGAATLAVMAVAAMRGAYKSAGWRHEGHKAAAGDAAGALAGLAVFFVWIAPETWLGVGAPVEPAASPYSPSNCGWALTASKLAASALVIPIA